MTQEQIVEGNKLIAEFMGFHFNDGKIYAEPPDKAKLYREAKYHSSWDWLMPVVEKIEGDKYYIGIDRNYCMVGELPYIGSPKSLLPTIKEDYKIDAVYKQCIQFIEYYNRHLKPTPNDTEPGK